MVACRAATQAREGCSRALPWTCWSNSSIVQGDLSELVIDVCFSLDLRVPMSSDLRLPFYLVAALARPKDVTCFIVGSSVTGGNRPRTWNDIIPIGCVQLVLCICSTPPSVDCSNKRPIPSNPPSPRRCLDVTSRNLVHKRLAFGSHQRYSRCK